MTNMSGAPLFCEDIGNTTADLPCCYTNDQTASVCKTNFNNPKVPTFRGGCQTGNCLRDCQDVSIIYASETQDDAFEGNGKAPIRRYLTCANVPNMARYLSTNPPKTDITSQIEKYIPRDASTDDALKNVTSAVTECLMATCRNARHKRSCDMHCTGVNLLLNSTTPNVQGINQCLNSLCTGGYDSLPYADADVVGIGVFASYIIQCMFVVLLCFGLMGFELFQRKPRKHETKRTVTPDQPLEKTNSSDKGTLVEKKHNHRRNYEQLLVQFHKAQCYFSATIQIASLSYGIFDTNMLITFLLIPLATNGILPVVFAYVLLLRCRKASMDATLLTTACCILASLVYWILYSHVIPINSQIRDENKKYRAYQQFMYKLSALQACGGYSALAVCPNNFDLGKDDITKASHNLRVLTPIIWSFSIFCLLVALGEKVRRWLLSRKYEAVSQSAGTEGSNTGEERSEAVSSADGSSRSPFAHNITYYLIVLCFLAGIGMQLSLLSVATSLHMMNRMKWSFGQIVAVTLWAPPLMGWLYDEIKELMPTRIRYGSRTRQRSNV